MVAGRFSSYLLQTRLFLAIFPGLAYLVAAGYDSISRIVLSRVRFRVLAGLLICLVLGLTALEVGLNTLKMGVTKHIAGFSTYESYVADNLGWHEPAMKALRKLPPGSRVLLLWEPRSLYCLPICEPDEVLDRWLRERYDNPSKQPVLANEILQKCMLEGYSHLLYYQAGADFVRSNDPHYRPQDWVELESLLKAVPLVENFGDTYLLFRLKR